MIGFLFRAAVLPTSMRAYSRDKQISRQIQGLMKNIIDAAGQTGNFHILLSAFKAASLIDTLRSPG